MATRSTPTPPKQGSPSASLDPPATPGARSSITPALATTPGALRQRTLPPATPGRSITSPFPARTPRTPGGTVTSCTSDKALLSIVTVHTAKCTECDMRNKDTMRRCPGCTFQVCKPCYERREKEGRGLMHGNSMSSAATPTTQRTVRKKPLASTPGGGSRVVAEAEIKKEDVATKTEDDGSEKKEVEEVKEKGKAKATPAPRMPRGKKRAAARKKPQVEDSTNEELSDGDFESDLTSPTPSKRRRTAPAMFTRRASDSSSSNAPLDPQESTGSRPSSFEPPYDIIHELCVKPYIEPLYRDPMPPLMKGRAMNRYIPLDRHTQEEHLKKIQEKAPGKFQEIVLKREEAKRKKDAEANYPHTIRAFVDAEAVKRRDDTTMDEDENEALFSTMKDAARKWGNQTHKKLDSATQNIVRPGLDMRLDKIDEAYKAELAKLLNECAARKLQELAQDNAPSETTTSPGQATDST